MKFRVERDGSPTPWPGRPAACRPARRPGAGRAAARGRPTTALTCSGFDYEVSAQATLDGRRRRRAGQALVSGRLLADICRSLPAQAGRHGRRRLPGHPHLRHRPVHACRPCRSRTTRRCPTMPEHRGTVASDVFAQRRGPGRDRGRPGRHAADADRRPDGDRRRRAAAGRPPTGSGWPSASWVEARPARRCRPPVLVPARTLADTAKTLTTGPEVTIALAGGGAGEGIIGFAGAGGRRTTTRLLDGEFPKYRSLFPSEHRPPPTSPVADADRGGQAGRAGRRARTPPVRLQFADGGADADRRRRTTRAAPRSDRGRVQRRATSPSRFNPAFLLDGLGCDRGRRSTARLLFTTPAKPAVLRRARRRHADADFRYLIMPARLLRLSAVPAVPDAGAEPTRRTAREAIGGRAWSIGLIGLGKMGGNMARAAAPRRPHRGRLRPQSRTSTRRRQPRGAGAAAARAAGGLGDGAVRRARPGRPSPSSASCSASRRHDGRRRQLPVHRRPGARREARRARASGSSTPASPAASGA